MTYPDHLPFSRQIRRSVAEAETCLESVEDRLQLGLLLQLGWFVLAAVVSELLQLPLRSRKCVVGGAVLQPRCRASDPFQQLDT